MLTSRAFLLFGLLLAACDSSKPEAASEAPSPKKPPSMQEKAPPLGPQVEELLLAELAAMPSDGSKNDRLVQLLAGPERVQAQAAFLLAKNCQQPSAEIESALIISLSSGLAQKQDEQLASFAVALSQCGDSRGEALLRRLVAYPPKDEEARVTRAAALGLGFYADRKGRLDDRSITALFDAAERLGDLYLLYPLSRLHRVPSGFEVRLLEVASQLLTRKEAQHRRLGIYAMGSAGTDAAAPLAQILISSEFSGAERAAAVQTLARLGSAGQKALDGALSEMLKRGLPLKATQEKWLPLREALLALERAEKSKQELREINEVVLPEGKDAAARADRRRLIWLRCASAELLGRTSSRAKQLLNCDPEQGEIFEAAQLRVLDRGPLTGQRAVEFEARLASKSAAIFSQALLLLTHHSEYPERLSLLQATLQHQEVGKVTAALEVLAHAPDLANQNHGFSEELVAALQGLFGRGDLSRQAQALLLQASGRSAALSLKPDVLKFCNLQNEPALSAAAERALHALGDPKAECPAQSTGETTAESPAESSEAQPSPKANAAGKELPIAADAQADADADGRPFILSFATELGELELTLDSPGTEAVRRALRKRIAAGDYNGLRVGSNSAGFAFQLGDRDGDGFEDAFAPRLTGRLRPEPLAQQSVGLTAFTVGAESGWLFVTLGEAPQLWGKKIQIGHARGPLNYLVYGDPLGDAQIREIAAEEKN